MRMRRVVREATLGRKRNRVRRVGEVRVNLSSVDAAA